MSQGTDRVNVEFNPSGSVRVDDVKITTAKLIDNLRTIVDYGGEAGRCAKISQERYEEAAMWAVKAITKLTGRK